MTPPVPDSVEMRFGERANQVRAVPAARAHTLSQVSASTWKRKPSTSSCDQTAPACGSTNCGSTATKNAMVLGFVSPTTKPWRRRVHDDVGAVTAPVTCAWRWRIAWMPSHTR